MKSGKYRVITGGVIALLLLAAASTAVLINLRHGDPFPEHITNSVNFPLAYPSQNKLNPDSIQIAGGVVSYTVNYRDSLLHISLQPSPKSFDFTSFEKQINQPKYIRTPLGKAVLGSLSNHQIGSLKTSDCWVLVTATQDTPQSDIEVILQQLKKSQSQP